MRIKAHKAGLGHRVLSLIDAVTALVNLYPDRMVPPPAVREVSVGDITLTDPIFETVRQDYAGFDEWFHKSARQGRRAWIVQTPRGLLAAVCIFKDEDSGPLGSKGRVVRARILKLCTFKVSEHHSGYRFGELLLKTAFRHAELGEYEYLYATCFKKHWELREFMSDFGFRENGAATSLGDIYLIKKCVPSDRARLEMDPLDFHVAYGPPAVKTRGARSFIIPIQPRYHDLLFPETTAQLSLLQGQDPFGNSIRKAYLCHSSITRITPGSILLFYRSGDAQSIAVVGVAEGALHSTSALKVARFVWKRTVYPISHITKMCDSKRVLAILFRQATVFRNPLPLAEIVKQGLIGGVPQSISEVRESGKEWLTERIEASF